MIRQIHYKKTKKENKKTYCQNTGWIMYHLIRTLRGLWIAYLHKCNTNLFLWPLTWPCSNCRSKVKQRSCTGLGGYAPKRRILLFSLGQVMLNRIFAPNHPTDNTSLYLKTSRDIRRKHYTAAEQVQDYPLPLYIWHNRLNKLNIFHTYTVIPYAVG